MVLQLVFEFDSNYSILDFYRLFVVVIRISYISPIFFPLLTLHLVIKLFLIHSFHVSRNKTSKLEFQCLPNTMTFIFATASTQTLQGIYVVNET
jgi:hypothetical protein